MLMHVRVYLNNFESVYAFGLIFFCLIFTSNAKVMGNVS